MQSYLVALSELKESWSSAAVTSVLCVEDGQTGEADGNGDTRTVKVGMRTWCFSCPNHSFAAFCGVFCSHQQNIEAITQNGNLESLLSLGLMNRSSHLCFSSPPSFAPSGEMILDEASRFPWSNSSSQRSSNLFRLKPSFLVDAFRHDCMTVATFPASSSPPGSLTIHRLHSRLFHGHLNRSTRLATKRRL